MSDPARFDSPASDVTGLFARWRSGDRAALELLLPLLYDELKRLAARQVRRERADLTLQATAVVHEAYLRLFGERPPAVENRQHFFALATRTMRNVLVDAARRSRAERRPPRHQRLEVAAAEEIADPGWLDDPGTAAEVLALDGALERLQALDPRQAQVVEMRFFGGMTLDETAAALAISEATVTREWRAARAWLKAELAGAGLRGEW